LSLFLVLFAWECKQSRCLNNSSSVQVRNVDYYFGIFQSKVTIPDLIQQYRGKIHLI
jgi:hypothetical protein